MTILFPTVVYAAGFTVTGIVAGITDWRSRKVSNRLTFPAIGLGLLCHGLLGGWHGMASSAIAVALIFVLMLPFVLRRSMGMGDYKLLLATSAFAGMDRFLWVLFFSSLAGALIGIWFSLRTKRLKSTLGNVPELLMHMAHSPLSPHEEINIDNPKALTFPFGVAVAIGCLATVAWTWVR